MRNDKLKFIGLITMTIDHIGWLFFPDIILFRIIGRVAFPIFAYQVTEGYKKTKNIHKYMTRLLIFAIISQVPYMLFKDSLNIMFTLLIGLWMIHLRKTNIILSLIPLLLSLVIDFEYGIYGLLTIYGFYVFKDIKAFFIGLNLIFFNPVQFFSIMALPLINYEFKKPLLINKYMFYIYYPLHLLILYLIAYKEVLFWVAQITNHEY